MKLFKTFRRHQKLAFALLTLMAMISFVILPIVLDIIQSRSGRDPVVLRTKAYGDLRRSELAIMVFQRQKIIAFLQAVYEQVMRARLARASSSAVPPVTQAEIMLRRIGTADEEAVANTWLLSQRARQVGMQVSDGTVRNTLARLLERQVSQKTFLDILRQIQLSETALFEYLRYELLALRVEELFNVSLVGTPPAQQWDYYLRMNRKAKIEAVAVPVADFVAQVPEPSEAQVRELFTRNKFQEPDPNSPEPGFRRPHRVAIEYFRADYNRFVDPSKVTEDEIRKYYEENKEFEFLEPQTPSGPPQEGAKSPEKLSEKPAEKPADKPADKPSEKPAAKPPAKGGDTAAQTSGEKPPAKPAKKPAELPAEKPAGPSAQPGPKTSEASGRGAIRLVAYRWGESEKSGATAAAGKAAASPPPPKPATTPPLIRGPQPESIESKTPLTPSAESKTAQAAPAAAAKPKAKPTEPKPTESKPADSKPAESKPTEPPPRKYKPLEQVRDQIRTILAQRAAETRAEEVLQKLEAPLRDYELKWLEHAKQRGTGSEPQRPDLKEWAAKYGITAKATGLITVWEVGNFDIARSRVDGQRSFAEVAFGPLNLYQRMRSKDVEGSAAFLFWKVEDDPEREVELDEPGVREQVIQAWKLRSARPLARQKAERLADEARQAQQSLKQVFASRGMKVVEPEPFTWLTFGYLPPPLNTMEARLSSVSGIEAPGEEFMAAVFSLEPGGVGAALNHPQTVAYVVRVVEFLPAWDVLWNDFIKGGLEFSSLVARREIQQSRLAWLEEIKAQAGFEWVEPPRRHLQR